MTVAQVERDEPAVQKKHSEIAVHNHVRGEQKVDWRSTPWGHLEMRRLRPFCIRLQAEHGRITLCNQYRASISGIKLHTYRPAWADHMGPDDKSRALLSPPGLLSTIIRPCCVGEAQKALSR